FNSKVYYVIIDNPAQGTLVYRFPITGNETVLDAIASLNSPLSAGAGLLPEAVSKRRIWVARPTPAHHACVQILPVDWLAITQAGSTRTNYQLFPGDRIFIKGDPLVRIDTILAKVLSPFNRLVSSALQASALVNIFRSSGNGNNNNGV